LFPLDVVKNMAMTTPRPQARPAKDEWGVYDPQQAGLTAVFARLDLKDLKAAVKTPAARILEAPEAPVAPSRPSLSDAK
jgi:hypothetical protein